MYVCLGIYIVPVLKLRCTYMCTVYSCVFLLVYLFFYICLISVSTKGYFTYTTASRLTAGGNRGKPGRNSRPSTVC